jgi:hypothetical protein
MYKDKEVNKNSQRFTNTVAAYLTMVHNYWHNIHTVIPNDWLSIAQRALLCQWL